MNRLQWNEYWRRYRLSKQEIWKVITKHPDYEISSLGNVRSNTSYSKGKILSPLRNKKGYLWVRLNGKNYKVHRLVGEFFLENPNNLPIINHKNGQKYDNRLVNLEWSTHGENLLHSYRYLGRVSPNKGKKGGLNHLSKVVYQYTNDGLFIKKFNSVSEASIESKILVTCISSCCLGSQKTAGGYIWKYN